MGFNIVQQFFITDDEQKEIAEKSKQTLDKSGQYENPIVTEIVPTPYIL